MTSVQNKGNKNLGAKARTGVFWYILKTLGSQGSRFITSIILARILFPEDFGIMGMVFVVTRFAQRIGEFGFSQVIVQIKNITEEHIKTTFTLNLILSFTITIIIFSAAPQLASLVMREEDAYLMPKVINVLRVISFNFIISGFYTIPHSIIKREMKFKQDSLIGLVAGMIGFLTPIPLALFGFGVWSIVFGNIMGQVVQVIGFYLVTHWKPRIGIYKKVFGQIFSFGSWMNVYSYVNYAINNIDYFMISKFLGAAQLGFYERAFSLMTAPRKRIGNMIGTVLFSTYSRMQDEDERLNIAFNKVMKTVSLLNFPLMIWLFFAAPSFITLLYGERWTATIIPTQIMCISGLVGSIAMAFDPVFIAKGLVKQRTKAYFFTLLILSIGVYFGAQKGINYVALAVALTSFFNLLFNVWFFQKHTTWTWKYLWPNLKPAFLITGSMSVLLIISQRIVLLTVNDRSIIMLIVISAVSFFGYIGAAYLFKTPETIELFDDIFGGLFKKIKKLRAKWGLKRGSV